MRELKGKKVLVTGGYGFFGRHIVKALHDVGSIPIPIAHREFIDDMAVVNNNEHLVCDFLHLNDTIDCLDYNEPDYIIHAAGYNGGINFNLKNPIDIFYDNTVMGLNVIDQAGYENIPILSIVASCGYPVEAANGEEFYEGEYFDGPPHDTVACHGYAKRNLQLASYFSFKQRQHDARCVCVTTLYGPGDSVDLEKTKVLGALIRRFLEAKAQNTPNITLWGTGYARRQFIYVEDAAKLVVQTLQYSKPPTEKRAGGEEVEKEMLDEYYKYPLNISTEHDYSIAEIAGMIAAQVGYTGEILWDHSKPDGQMRKQLDNETLFHRVCYDQMFDLNKNYEFPRTTLAEGLKKTIPYYKERLGL